LVLWIIMDDDIQDCQEEDMAILNMRNLGLE
jgi:hypothetical protein